MCKGLLGSLGGLLASAGLVLAQAPTTVSPALSPTPALLTAQESVAPVPANGSKPAVSPAQTAGPAEAPLWHEPVASAPGRYYMAGEYLLWWPKRDNLPALATTAFGRMHSGFVG